MNPNSFSYYVINKPFDVLSQFTDGLGRKTLSKYLGNIKGIYPVGRLDLDSEGLLLLTNDTQLTNFILNPINNHEREYICQIEGIPNDSELEKLEKGVIIEKKLTLPAKVKIIENPIVWDRIPPIRERKNIPTCWISVTLIEGRNRQVRKMTASIGHPTLRLIRVRIKNILLNDLQPGKSRMLSDEEVRKLKG